MSVLATALTSLAFLPGVSSACEFPHAVQDIEFSSARYPGIREHYLQAVKDGWPRVLVLDRVGADQRRDRLLRGKPTRSDYDRDEYPPAIGREGWLADVDFVLSAENRSHGSSLGNKLRRYCDGVRFRYVFVDPARGR